MDVIARRLRLSFLNVQAAEEALPVVVQIMGDELGWDQQERNRQTEEAVVFLRSQMGKDVNKASQDNIPVSLTKAEIAEYVKKKQILSTNLEKAFSIILGQCTYDLQKKLEANQNWPTIFST